MSARFSLSASRFVFGSFLLPLGLALACSSSSSSGDGTTAAPDVPGTVADFDKGVQARATAFCDRIFGCCDTAGVSKLMTIYGGGKTDRASCEDGVKAWLRDKILATTTGLQKKETDYYPSREAECVKAEAAKSCTDFFALGEGTEPFIGCAKAFVGKTKDGAACGASSTCASGFCKLSDDKLSGNCAPEPKEGDACASGSDCGATGLYCFRTGAPPKCTFTDGQCKAREGKEDGASCCNPEECAGQTCSMNQKGQTVCNKSKLLKCNK